jgi:hypothetical protein
MSTVVITSRSQSSFKQTKKSKNVVFHLIKPLNIDKLIKSLNNIFGKRYDLIII